MNTISTVGTSLRGYIKTSYTELVARFGKPMRFEGEKVRAKWVIEQTINGKKTVATIYDYKGDCKLSDATSMWHVGGFDSSALDLVRFLTGSIVTGDR